MSYAAKANLSIVFSLLVLMLAFQNCNKMQYTDIADEEVLKSNNNGGSYEGKLIGNYYRLVNGFACEQTPAPLAHIMLTDISATYTINEPALCGAQQQALPPSSIDTSIFQNELIGYLDGIYQILPTPPILIPAKIVEFWCRDRLDEQGVEVITYYDYSTQESSSKIYYATLNPSGTYTNKTIPEFPVTSSTLLFKQTLSSPTQSFELLVFRDQPSPMLQGLYAGRIESVLDGQFSQRAAWCRLGARFDSGK